MKSWTLQMVVLMLAPSALGDGLKKVDLGARAPSLEQNLREVQNLSPEQLKKLQASYPSGNSGQSRGIASSPEDLERLLLEMKKLNKVMEERSKTLEKLMDETP